MVASASRKKLILDLDTGVDDTLALAYALGSPEVELIGITGTFGNVRVDTGVRNSLAVLALFGHPDVPVFRGFSHALAATSDFEVPEPVLKIHGDNGIGNVSIPDAGRAPEAQHAVDFLIESARRFGSELLYVPTGPITTLAAALEKAPGIATSGMQVTLMGGALTVPGNVSPCAEANVGNDPEAMDVVLRSDLPTCMVGLDVTLQAQLTRADTAAWRALGTPAATFLADMTDFYIDFYVSRNPAMDGCALHDPLALGVAIDPSLVTCLPLNMMVDLEGPERGRTIGDPDRLCDPTKTASAAVRVDAVRFQREFLERVGRALADAPAGRPAGE